MTLQKRSDLLEEDEIKKGCFQMNTYIEIVIRYSLKIWIESLSPNLWVVELRSLNELFYERVECGEVVGQQGKDDSVSVVIQTKTAEWSSWTVWCVFYVGLKPNFQ